MNILVTGGAGFIGVNLCKMLIAEGHSVVCIDNLITGSMDNVRALRQYKNFHFLHHDITQPFTDYRPAPNHDEVSGSGLTITDYQLIYHLACPTGVPNITKYGEEMLRTSTIGTFNVLQLAKECRAKVLFTSSSEVYGEPLKEPQSENYSGNVDPVGPRSPYEEGKRAAEAIVKLYALRDKVDAKIARVFNTYGPGMAEGDTRVIPTFLKQALQNKPLTVHGDGKQTRTFCYVDDLLMGLRLILDRGRVGEVYNIGSDRRTSIIELAKEVIKISGSLSEISFVERPVHDHNSRLPALDKIAQIGWKPTTTLDVGLSKTIKARRTDDETPVS